MLMIWGVVEKITHVRSKIPPFSVRPNAHTSVSMEICSRKELVGHPLNILDYGN